MSSPAIPNSRKSLLGGIYLVLSLLIFAFSVYQLNNMPSAVGHSSQATQFERTSISTYDSATLRGSPVSSYTY